MTESLRPAWIFQANPARFDIPRFISNSPAETEWSVSRYANDLSTGDRVFLWCSAGHPAHPSGVFAQAEVISSVRSIPDDSPIGLWTDDADRNLVNPRVRIRLDRFANKKEVIKRDWWKDDPILRHHLIMTMPNHTTFRLEGAPLARLEHLWEKIATDWTYEDALAGLYAFVETSGKAVSKLPDGVVSDVALQIGRPIAGVYNKVMNFRSLDPSDPRVGFDGASEQDRVVWATFFNQNAGLDHAAVRRDYQTVWGELRAGGKGRTLALAGPASPLQGQLPPSLFRDELSRFRREIERVSGSPFVSFQSGMIDEWEGYKPRLREKALGILSASEWDRSQIGSGDILDRTLAAIEIPPTADLKNNLVGWQNQYGHASRSHRALLDAQENPERRLQFEQFLFEFFRADPQPADAMSALIGLGVTRYDLCAYLLFLKDMDRFMPIAPTTFDKVFKRLGLDLVTTSRCSWENYHQYNQALAEVQAELRKQPDMRDARLIDAHSFCWVLGRIEGVKAASAAPRTGSKGKAPVTVYDARRKAIYTMVANAFSAAQGANGQVVERQMKNKDVRMSKAALEELVGELLDSQKGLCALTGLMMQFHGEHHDDQLLVSLDRIDSDGHYERGNLQIVCRFVNSWKSTTHNDEFIRLLSIVRAQSVH